MEASKLRDKVIHEGRVTVESEKSLLLRNFFHYELLRHFCRKIGRLRPRRLRTRRELAFDRYVVLHRDPDASVLAALRRTANPSLNLREATGMSRISTMRELATLVPTTDNVGPTLDCLCKKSSANFPCLRFSSRSTTGRSYETLSVVANVPFFWDKLVKRLGEVLELNVCREVTGYTVSYFRCLFRNAFS